MYNLEVFLTGLFFPLLFITFIIVITVFLLLFATKLNTDTLTRIASGLSILLSIIALILSLYSTYFVYEQSKLPDLDLQVKFLKLTNVSPERAPLISQLGGIYQIQIKNVGDRDAISPFMYGGIQVKGKAGEYVQQFQEQYLRFAVGDSSAPYYLKKLEPSSLYYMYVWASCSNCLQVRRWWVTIDTSKQEIKVEQKTLGMWEKVELW